MPPWVHRVGPFFRIFFRFSHICLWQRCVIEALETSQTWEGRVEKVQACQQKYHFNATDGNGRKRMKHMVAEEVPSWLLGVWLYHYSAGYCSQ